MIKESTLFAIIVKLTAIVSAVSGALVVVNYNAVASGIALSAVGVTTYVANKSFFTEGYEKTRHVPPCKKSGKKSSQDAKPAHIVKRVA